MEVFRKLYPREFLKKFTSQGVRPDGRKLERARKLNVAAGTITSASGSAVVTLGATRVVAGVRAELARVATKKVVDGPAPAEGGAGETAFEVVGTAEDAPLFAQCGQSGLDCSAQHIAVNVDMPPLCSARFRGGAGARLPAEALVVAQRLNAVVRAAGAALVDPAQFVFDDDGLCTWFLHVDVVCTNYDGAVYDAALIAVVAALRTVTLWRGHIEDDDGDNNSTARPVAHADSAFRLALGSVPVASTFATFDDAVLVDPTSEEEALQDARITVTCDSRTGRVYELAKPLGSPVPLRTISSCVQTAQRRAARVGSLIQTISV